MILSAKVEYACVAVLELALQYGAAEPVRLRTISEAHGIPSPFLVQIMLQLKAAGLVESTRGAAGGYQLRRDPADITLAEVKAIIDGAAGDLASNLSDPTQATRVLLDAWQQVSATERELLAEITFGELLGRVRGCAEEMYFI